MIVIRRLSDESGVAMVIAVMVLALTLLMAFATLDETLSSRSLTNRDGHQRGAQQAAEAGVARELYEESEANVDDWSLNGGPLGLSSTLDCLPVTLNASAQITGLATATVNSSGVCPESSGSGSGSGSVSRALGNHEFEETEFIPGQTNLLGGAERVYWPKIVSLGSDTSGGSPVYSREEVLLQPVAALQAVEAMNNATLKGLTLPGVGSTMVVNGDVQARGKVTLPSVYVGVNLSTPLSGSVAATVAAPSISGSVVSTINGGTVSKSQIPLRQPVSIATTKSSCPSGGCPSVSGGNSGDGYNASADTFTMTKSTASATFAAGDYVFCNFNVTNGTVNVNPTSSAPVRIFIDSPTSSRCASNGLGSSQGNFNAGTGVNNLLGGTAAPSGLQIYVVGDGSYDDGTSVTIGHSCVLTCISQNMVIYAPTSNVTVTAGVSAIAGVFDGAIVGNDVSVTASTLTQDLDLGNYPLYDGVQVFRVRQYLECSSQPTDSSGNTYTTLKQDPSIDTNGC